jgi:DNA invertase Pin-like site-specific DNA recombinase
VAVDKYLNGISARDLARQYGINQHTVAKLLQRDGVIIRGGQIKMTPDLIGRAEQLYTDGQSLAAIGAELSVDPGTVRRQLRKRGTRMRNSHGRDVESFESR